MFIFSNTVKPTDLQYKNVPIAHRFLSCWAYHVSLAIYHRLKTLPFFADFDAQLNRDSKIENQLILVTFLKQSCPD